MTVDRAALVVGTLRLASGISFLVDPVRANKAWGDPVEPVTTTKLLLRSMGYRDALVGGLLVAAALRGRDTRGWFLASGGADAADFVGGLSVHDEMTRSQQLKGIGGAVVGISVGLWEQAGAHDRPVNATKPFGARILGRADQSMRSVRIRVQLLLTLFLTGTNLVGALLVFVTANFVIPGPELSRRMTLVLAVAVPVYVFVAIVVGTIVGTATSLRALRWATDGRTPDDHDRRTALRVPLRLTQMQASMWFGAVVVFTALSLTIQPGRALMTASTVAIAGLVVSAVAYLLTEFAMRPIAARALSGSVVERPRGSGVGDRLVIFWLLGTGAPVVGLMLSATLALAGVRTSKNELAVVGLVIGGVVLTFGLLVTVLNARSVVAPITSVRDALADVEQGDLDREVVVYDGTELGQLQAGFNQMVGGLRERENLRDLFGRHVGVEVAAAAAELGEVELGGQVREASVLFVDLVGSTGYTTSHSPEEVVEMLNRFFAVVVDEVDRRSGLVNKFVGDAVLAVFGVPVALPDHAERALAAARAMAARLTDELPEIGAGIGVATGSVVAGNVGHHSRFEYTVIGDAVNSASRLTDLAKDAPGRLLATWASVEAAGPEEAAYWRAGDAVVLRGRDQATRLAVSS